MEHPLGDEPVEEAEASEAPTPPSQAASGAQGPQAAAPRAPASADELDALAGKLMGPIVRRLKSELLLDRERRGMRIDAF